MDGQQGMMISRTYSFLTNSFQLRHEDEISG